MRSLCKLIVVCGFAAAVAALPYRAQGADSDPGAASIRVESVHVVVSQAGPVLLLRVGNKVIPIFVDIIVAESIQGALTGEKTARPLTHDLMHTILAAYDGKVSQVIVTLKEGTFYAALTLDMQHTSKIFDSRSSDAIALAIHFKAPILVSRELIDSAGVEVEKKPGEIKL